MADTKTVIDIKIETAQAAASIKDLRKSLKDLVDQQATTTDPKEWKKLTKAINETEGKIGDLNDSFSTLKGSGVERLNASVGLLTEGFGTLDTDKIKTGFKGIGQAMGAIPILLVVEGFKLLIENLDIITEAFKEFFNIEKDAADATQEMNDKLEKQNEIMAKNKAAMDSIIQNNQAYINRQIEVVKIQEKIKDLEADGLDHTKEINKLKKESIELEIQNLKATLISQQGNLKAQEELAIKTQIYQKQQELARVDIVKQEKEKEQKIVDNAREIKAKALADEEAERLRQQAQLDEINKTEAQKRIDAEAEENRIKGELYAATTQYKNNLDKEAEAKRVADKKASDKAIEEAEMKSLATLQSMSQAFFAFQLNRAKGNAQKEIEIKKRMFEVDKAFNVARAIQDGIRSVQAALTIPPPGGQILAIVNAAAAAANVAKILATKFDAGAAPSAGGVDAATGGTGAPNIPTVNTSAPSTQASTTFDAQGRNTSIVAKVYEGEMTSSQKRQAKLEQQATI